VLTFGSGKGDSENVFSGFDGVGQKLGENKAFLFNTN